jgi:hypothetical protein
MLRTSVRKRVPATMAAPISASARNQTPGRRVTSLVRIFEPYRLVK